MWEILHNSAGWDCFRTLTLPEILKTQNRPQVEICAYLEVTRFWKSHVRANKLDVQDSNRQFHTVQRNLKLFLLMLVYEWMEFPLLISGIW